LAKVERLAIDGWFSHDSGATVSDLVDPVVADGILVEWVQPEGPCCVWSRRVLIPSRFLKKMHKHIATFSFS
jgi:hypothetical protein